MFTSTLCSEKNTHSRFILYLRGKCLDLHKFFRVCLRGLKYSMDIKIKYSFNFFATDDVILTSCLHVCEIMGFRIEDKHLIKCLRVSNSNEYLILTSMECLITYQHTLKFCINRDIFHRDIKGKRKWVFLLSEHQTKTPNTCGKCFDLYKIFRVCL